MKVIFSRKGVDGENGKCSSALVDGRPISLPIPMKAQSASTFGDLSEPLRSLARDLSKGALADERPCHLDPDIDFGALPARPAGWRGAFGQAEASLSHLRNQRVGPGDLFIFWGRYRPVHKNHENWAYCGPVQHVVFGWLAIGQVLDAGTNGSRVLQDHGWLRDHPHARTYTTSRNAIYVAADCLRLGDKTFDGSGCFARGFRLSKTFGDRPSLWSVPDWLNPESGGVGMSYHPAARWGEGVVQTVAKGQEFVADIGDRCDARTWLTTLLEDHR